MKPYEKLSRGINFWEYQCDFLSVYTYMCINIYGFVYWPIHIFSPMSEKVSW